MVLFEHFSVNMILYLVNHPCFYGLPLPGGPQWRTGTAAVQVHYHTEGQSECFSTQGI